MAFTLHGGKPHHIWHERFGWLTPAGAEAFGVEHRINEHKPGAFAHTCVCVETLGRALKCPTDSHHPEVEHSHDVEVDCSTGMVGYTRR